MNWLGAYVGWFVGSTVAVAGALGVFVAAVGWNGEVSDWYYVPVVVWGVLCGVTGFVLGSRYVRL